MIPPGLDREASRHPLWGVKKIIQYVHTWNERRLQASPSLDFPVQNKHAIS